MTDITFEEYLLKKYDINQIEEEKENKQRVLRNTTFKVGLKGFKEFLLPTTLLYKKSLEARVKDIEISSRETRYITYYENLKKAVTDREALLSYLKFHGVEFTISEEYDSLKYWKKESNLTNIALTELNSLTKDSIEIEVKESVYLNEVIVGHLKTYYQGLLNDSINNKQLITTIKDDIKKFDMVLKYNKRLINCKIITI